MTTNHIDQLAQWYADAERITSANLPCAGDALIFPYNAGGYAVEAEEDGWTPDDVVPGESVRILARAPKPKPAWHDAVAVMAGCSNAPEDHREPFIRSEATPGVWIGEGGYGYADDLRDVTPLIEAKVTGEMVESAREEAKRHARVYWERSLVSRMLTAALGLETT